MIGFGGARRAAAARFAFDFGLCARLCAALRCRSSEDCRWIAAHTLSFTNFQSANCSSALAISMNFIADSLPRIYVVHRSERKSA